MGNDHCTTGEFQKRIFQRRQRFNIEVVGRFVQKQEISPLLQGEREIQSVTLTTGKDARGLLLVCALETKGRNVSTRRHFNIAHLDVVQAVGDNFPQSLVGIDTRAVLVDIAELDGFTDGELSPIKRFKSNNGLKQSGLTDAVGTDHTDNTVSRQGERQAIDQNAIAKALLKVARFDDDVTQAGPRRNLDLFEVKLSTAFSFGSHFFVALQTRLRLCLASLGTGSNPLEFFLQALSKLGILLTLNLKTLFLRLQVSRVVAFVGVQVTTVNLSNPLCNVVEEVAIVGHSDHCARVGRQMLFQPKN